MVAILLALSLRGDHFTQWFPICSDFDPLLISPNCHASIVIFFNEQWILGCTGLGRDQVELEISCLLLRNSNFPSFFEDGLVRILSAGKDLFELKREEARMISFFEKAMKTDVSQFLLLVPEFSGLVPKA